jgi:RimJ/RimL family protein N-acetyltransferase
MTHQVRLRDVHDADLPIFFEHQRDPDAYQMAAFSAREYEPFMAHWAKIRSTPPVMIQTILCDEQVAGNILCFEEAGKQEVGYWLGKDFWGRGVATQALGEFLKQVPQRPLYAFVAKHNLGSRRVLEKCGFAVCEVEAEGFLLKLDGPA